jgi:hypothetical protein
MAYRRAQQKNGPSIGKMILGAAIPTGLFLWGKDKIVDNTLRLTGKYMDEHIMDLLEKHPELAEKYGNQYYIKWNKIFNGQLADAKLKIAAYKAQARDQRMNHEATEAKAREYAEQAKETGEKIRTAKNPATNPNEPAKPTTVEDPAANSNTKVIVGANNSSGTGAATNQVIPRGQATTANASAGAGGAVDAQDAARHTLQDINALKDAQAPDSPIDHGTNPNHVTDLINHGTTGADTSAISDHVTSGASGSSIPEYLKRLPDTDTPSSAGDLSNILGNNPLAGIISKASGSSDVADAASHIGSALGFSRIRSYNCPLTHGNVYNFSRYRRHNGYNIVPTYFSSRVSDDLPQDDANFLMRKMSANRPLIPSLFYGGTADLFYNKGTNKPLALGNVAFNMVMPVAATAALAANPLLALGTAITGVIANNAIYRRIKKSLLKREEAKRIKAGLPI